MAKIVQIREEDLPQWLIKRNKGKAMHRSEMLSKEFHQLKTGVMIRCRYLGATDHKGARIKSSIVRDSEFFISKTYHWDYSINHNENYLVSAQAILKRWNDYRKDGIPEIKDAVIHTFTYDAKNHDYIFICS
jgi:hypothetical protein|tara:strand:- start:9025 stop:9420 length:396 start_codon:yes stop_codon:yes gene_type:complete